MSKPTACAKEIIEQINTLRLNPSQYASKIEEYIQYFNGPIIKIPGIKAFPKNS